VATLDDIWPRDAGSIGATTRDLASHGELGRKWSLSLAIVRRAFRRTGSGHCGSGVKLAKEVECGITK
jgi:hypothetical protein